MEHLGQSILKHTPWGMTGDDAQRIAQSINERWSDPKDSNSWEVDFGADEARAHALLALLNSSAWLAPEEKDLWQPIAETEWQERLAAWLPKAETLSGETFWNRNENQLPITTCAASELDQLVPATGLLYQAALHRLPSDCLLLQGESFDNFWLSLGSQPAVLLALQAQDIPPARCRLALMLYQALLLIENCGQGSNFLDLSQSRSQSRSRSLSRLRSRSLSRSQSLSRWRSPPLLLSRSLSQSQSLSLSLSLSWSLSLTVSLSEDDNFSSALTAATRKSLEKAAQIDADKITEVQFDYWAQSLQTYFLRWAALDWFDEQSEDTGLARRRGIKNKQPLPAELGLFDSEGMPLPTPERANVERLLEWLEDDERVIAFGAADATSEELEIISADLEILRNQPWSPANFVRAILADWPAHQPTMDCSLAAADAELGKQSELLIINNE